MPTATKTQKPALERVNFRDWDRFLNLQTPGYAAPGRLIDIGPERLPVRVCDGIGKALALVMTPSPGGAETTAADAHAAVISWLMDGAPEHMDYPQAREWALRKLSRLDVTVEYYDPDVNFIASEDL